MATEFEKQSSNLLNKLKKDTLQYAPAIIIPALLNLIAVMIYTRIFEPEEYGVYNLVISTSTVVSSIFSQWVVQSTQRYRPNYVNSGSLIDFNKGIMSLVAFLTISIVLLSTIIFLLFYHFLADEILLYIVSVFLVLFQVLFNIGVVIFQSDMKAFRYRFYQLLNGIFKFTFSILIIFLIVKDIMGIILGTGLALLLLITPLYKESGLLNKEFLKFNKEEFAVFFKKMFLYGFPMIGWFLGNSLLGLSDRYFITLFRGAEEVGIYTANYSLITMGLGLLCSPLLTAAHPVIMNNITNNNQKHIQMTITKFSKMFLLFALPFSSFIIFFSSEIVDFLLGSKFREGSIIFPFLVIGNLLWNFTMYGHKGHEILGKTKVMMTYVFISVLVNSILNILLIPNYGYLGAAIASLIGYATYPLLIYFSSSKTIKWIIPWSALLIILISSIASCVIGQFLLNVISNVISMPLILELITSFVLVFLIYLILIRIMRKKV